MSELKQSPNESSLALIEEMQETAKHLKEEAQEASKKLEELGEKKRLLQSAMHKTKSMMAQTIILKKIDEIENKEEDLKKKFSFCNANTKNYEEIVRVLEEAIKEF